MRKNLTALVLGTSLAFLPVSAIAASGTVTGAAGGAVTGAIVGGPVGAAVGGVIGAFIGTAIDPPPIRVVSYVAAQLPPPAVFLQGNLVVGAVLPETVILYPVPTDVYIAADGRAYAYAIVNGRRIVVDAQTRVVVAFVG
ncbi:MAG: DUF1236 domain-containing protein [Bauldia sp.]